MHRNRQTKMNRTRRAARMMLCVFLIANLILSLVPFEVYAQEKDEAQIEREIKEQSSQFDEEKESLEKAADEMVADESVVIETENPDSEQEEAVEEGAQEQIDAPEETELKETESSTIESADLRTPEVLEEDKESEIDGELIEIDEYSKTYKIDEDSYITRISAEPYIYTKDNEQIEIDNTLEEDDGAFVNTDNSYEINLPKEGDSVSIEDSGYVIEMKPLFGKLDNAAAEENAIRYNEVSDGIDLQYTANASYVKEDIILMHPQDEYSYEYELTAENPKGGRLDARLEDGVINIYDASNELNEDILVYTVDAPVMTDADNAQSYDVSLNIEEKEETYILRVEADAEWLNSEDRVYPVKIDPAVTMTLGQDNMEWHLVENGKSGDGILAGPDVNHNHVTYMYAGYEDGSLLGSDKARYGYTRSFLKINYNFKQLRSKYNIPSDAVIDAKFRIYKFRGTPPSGTRVLCKMVNDGWKGGTDYTWNNKPASYTQIGDPVDVSKDGWKSFDITEAVKAWERGTANRGLVLVPEKEKQEAVVFSGPGNPATGRSLYLDISWKMANELDDEYPLNAPKVELWPLSTQSAGKQVYTGLIGTGIIRPGLNAEYTLEEAGSGKVVASGTFKNTGKFKIYPDTDKMSENIKYTLGYYGINSGNFQTKGLPSNLLKKNTPYRLSAAGKSGSTVTPRGNSDEFIIYEFSLKDTYPYVANYYGVSIDQITKDNRPADYIGTKGSTIFIRSPKRNSTTAYTRKAKLDPSHAEDLIYANLGRGLCADFDLEPINTSNGNFTLEQTDAKNEDYLEGFKLSRTYNSVGDKDRGLFGYGWSFEYDQSIVSDGEAYIYNVGDGRRFRFLPDGDSYACELMPHLRLKINRDLKKPENSNYTLVEEKERTTYTFNYYGLLVSVKDKYGDAITIKRSAGSNIEKITTASGKEYKFSLNNDGTVKEIIIPSGHKLKYSYKDGTLVSYTNADGGAMSYKYNADMLMTEFSDGNEDRQINNEYD